MFIILATHKWLRTVSLTLIVVTIVGLALLCKPALTANVAANRVAIGDASIGIVADINLPGTLTSLLKCYMGSCGMESQTP